MNLEERKTPPSAKTKNAKSGKPTASNYKFSPRSFGQLSEFVNKIKWNSVEKTLTLSVYETPLFEVMKWTTYLEDQYIEYQRSPFVDTDNSTAILDLLDYNDHKVATFRFKNLKVENHECLLNSDVDDFLKYELVVSYQHVEMVVHANRRPNVEEPVKTLESDNVESDEEWQETV